MTISEQNKMNYYKAFIRVVKSLSGEQGFGGTNIIREPLIIAKDKDEVKQVLFEKYPQFFTNGKIYEKSTKDEAQFFYVVIFELYNYERQIVLDNIPWTCANCGHIHANEYISKPRRNERLFGDKKFCRSTENEFDNSNYDLCMEAYTRTLYEGVELPDDKNYIKSDSPNYIYKVTEKSTNKCYIGKTRNAPFFRWWNHLTHSSSPFGIYLRQTKLSDWTFEVIDILPSNTPDSEVFRIESESIHFYDSIKNGYNSVISQKKQEQLQTLFDNI